jgi:hypothetical protein
MAVQACSAHQPAGRSQRKAKTNTNSAGSSALRQSAFIAYARGFQMDSLEAIIKFLGGSALLLAAVAWLARSLIKLRIDKDLKEFEHSLKKRADDELEAIKIRANEDLESLKDNLQRERDVVNRAAEVVRARDDRIRTEILRWANPILDAVRALKSRLQNILHRDGHIALSETGLRPIPENWSISYDYFMPSTLYLFCQYFYWVRRLQEELTFELFTSHADKDKFFERLRRVTDALGEWPAPPPACIGIDQQVFTLQQRVLGESMAAKQEGRRCMGYDEFKEIWEERPFADHLAPLRALLEDLSNDRTDCRWRRLEAVRTALDGFDEHCKMLLELPASPAVSRE